MNNLKNKTALITGATSGIGKSCANQLAKMKVNLVLVGRREEKLKTLKEKLVLKYGIKIIYIVLDVRDQKNVEKKFKKLLSKTNIDILINNAGLALGVEKIDEGLLSNWEPMIDTNIKGLLYVSQIIIPHMRKRNSGHIINLGSIAGVMTYPGGNVYCATKSAVHALSKAMNIDLVGTDIRVSNVAPGAVETEFSNVRFHGNDSKADAVYEGFEPLKAKDISSLVVYILNAPKHVNIQDTLIMPTAQRNPYTLHREENE
jgi:3-hydroxy acid dehydrogenase/malonic semialdehyde reductase